MIEKRRRSTQRWEIIHSDIQREEEVGGEVLDVVSPCRKGQGGTGDLVFISTLTFPVGSFIFTLNRGRILLEKGFRSMIVTEI